MEASPTLIIDYFNGFKQALVPLFQRPYEWGEVQWKVLWNDLMEQYDPGHDTTHFMGAVVTMPAKSVPVGVAKFLLIDGQQRLTTISLILCAIRDEIEDPSDKLFTKINNFQLTNFGYEGSEYYKVLPTQIDRTAYCNLVDCKPTNTPSNILSAYEYFRARLKGKDADGESITPQKVLEVIERRLMVVSINLGDADDPYLIFESLNFKGSSLTQADLVRNYFVMRFPVTAQTQIYEDLWVPMQNRLGDELTEFIRQYLMTKGDVAKKGEVYSVLKGQLTNLSSGHVEAELAAMGRFSEYYIRFVHPRNESNPELMALLERLKKWDVAAPYPLMLKLYDACERGRMTQLSLNNCLRKIESFIVRRTFCAAPTNQLVKMFVGWCKVFPESADIEEWLTRSMLEGTAGRRWPDDQEFFRAWLTAPLYVQNNERCRVVLEELERDIGHKEPADLTKSTIEHVMPQTLSAKWLDELGVQVKELYPITLHTVGNLTLSGYNSELSNLDFQQKKAKLSVSHIGLNEYFRQVERWDFAAITERSMKLFETAKRIWAR